MALDFFAGCVGGAAGILVGHPLDTVKVRIQTQCPINPKYRGTFHCLTSIAKQESMAGLYKGIASPLYGVAAINAMVFGVYGLLKPVVSGSPGNDALWAHFMAGSVSGAVQSVIASPMELIKTRMQLDESPGSKGKSAWDVLKHIYMKEGGLRSGLFKGWCVTLAREIPGLGTYFATYEALTANTGREISTFEMMMAGGMAGVFSWIACFPMDVVKTRLQSDITGKYTGAIDCYRKTVATEGYKALFRGLNSTVIRAFPTNAATFTAVMWVMRLAEEARDDTDVTKNNLATLLEQWDTARVQEKIVDSLRIQTPQYSFLSVDTQLRATNSNFFQQNHAFAQTLANSYSNSIANTNTSSSSNSSSQSISIKTNIKTDKNDTSLVQVVDSLSNENVKGNDKIAQITNVSTTPPPVKVAERTRRRTMSSGTTYLYPNSTLSQFTSEEMSPNINLNLNSNADDSNNTVLRRMSVSMNGEYMVKSGATSSSRSNSPTLSSSSSSTSASPSASTTSTSPTTNTNTSNTSNTKNKGDLITMLAEILDLPPVVIQNSLDGKPITLFNIIVTWLKEGSHFSNFCKCLDALDHCVCYGR